MIHTHSKHCVMVTLLYPGKEFRITHQEMIKGMKKGTTGINYRWDEENKPPPPPFLKGGCERQYFTQHNMATLTQLFCIEIHKGSNGDLARVTAALPERKKSERAFVCYHW